MNNNLKLVIAGAGSFIAGYLVANWRNEKFYFDRANEEVQAAREEYESQTASMREALEGNARVDEEIEDKDLIAKASEALSSYQGKGGFEPVDVHAVAEKIQYSDYNTEEAEKLQPREVEEQKPSVDILTTQQYMADPVDYEQTTLLYYAGDKALVGGRTGEGRVDDELRDMITGGRSDILERPEFWEKEEVWYFRNHEMKYDFEIMFEAGKFSDEESPGEDG